MDEYLVIDSHNSRVPIPYKSLLSLEEAGRLANHLTADATFKRFRERKAKETIRRHRADLTLFRQYLQEAHIVVGEFFEDPLAWKGMTKGLVEGFVQWQLAKGYAIGSVNMRLATVKVYCKLALGAGALDEREAAMIQTVMGYRGREGKRIDRDRTGTRQAQAKKVQPTKLTVAQAKALIDQPDTPQGRRDRVLMCLLLYHGLRCEEVQLLQVSAFDLETGCFQFEQPKVAGELRHRMHMVTYLAVKRYLQYDQPQDFLLPCNKKDGSLGGTMSKRAIHHRVKVLGAKVELLTLSPHDCRHFYAWSASEVGTDLQSLKDAGGWKTLAMPSRYIGQRTIANEKVVLSH